MTEIETPVYAGASVLEVMTEAKRYNRYLLALIERHLRPDCKVLDFGAGAGTFALPLLQRGVAVCCVEPDAALAAHLKRAGAAVAAELADVPDQSLDLIYTLNVLEHIADDHATIRALSEKLRSDGTLLVYVPAFNILYSSFDARIGHLRRYRRAPLAQLIAAAGLKVTESRYVDSIGFVVALLFRAFQGANISPTTVRIYDTILFPLSLVMDKILYSCAGKNVLVVARKL